MNIPIRGNFGPPDLINLFCSQIVTSGLYIDNLVCKKTKMVDKKVIIMNDETFKDISGQLENHLIINGDFDH